MDQNISSAMVNNPGNKWVSNIILNHITGTCIIQLMVGTKICDATVSREGWVSIFWKEKNFTHFIQTGRTTYERIDVHVQTWIACFANHLMGDKLWHLTGNNLSFIVLEGFGNNIIITRPTFTVSLYMYLYVHVFVAVKLTS